MPRALAKAGCSAIAWWGNQLLMCSASATVPPPTNRIRSNSTPRPSWPAGLVPDPFDDLPLGRFDQGAHVVVFAMQPHDLELHGMGCELLTQGLQIKTLLNPIGHDLLHVQHPALQEARGSMENALALHHHVIGSTPTDIDDGDGHRQARFIEQGLAVLFDDHAVIPGRECLGNHLMECDTGGAVGRR